MKLDEDVKVTENYRPIVLYSIHSQTQRLKDYTYQIIHTLISDWITFFLLS